MFNTYLISYDPDKRGKEHDDLYKYIKSFSHWMRILESTWLIRSNKEYETISNEIKSTVHPEDRIFISQINI